MGERTARQREVGQSEDDAVSSLDALSRTLESLEARLASATRPRSDAGGRQAASAQARTALAEAVSQIVMRRQMLERPPVRAVAEAREERGSVHNLAVEVEGLRRDDASLAAAAGIAEELRELRGEIQAQRAAHPDGFRLDALRQGFHGLREAVSSKGPPAAAEREIGKLESALSDLARSGVGDDAIGRLRSELSTIRTIVDGAEPLADRRSVPQELERLRASFGGEGFERDERLLSTLRSEMNQLREKMGTLASERSLRAVEERWQGLEGRFASRDIEATIGAMADRMAQIEMSLARLPETLPIGTLQNRIESLAAVVEIAVARREAEEEEVDHFCALEERLDEISEALLTLSQRPTLDTAPLERIETRVTALSSRLDALNDSIWSENLGGRVDALAGRVEEIARDDRSQLLAERLDSFGQALDRLFAEQEQARHGAVAIEAKLTGLSERLDQEIASRVDPELVRSLEDQISGLSRQLAGLSAGMGASDPRVEERLAAIEQRLSEDREAVIAAARAAAEEAVTRLMEAGDRRQGEHVRQLSDALRALEALSAENDRRMTGVVDAVHETLLKIVARLDQIEDEIVGEARAGREPVFEPHAEPLPGFTAAAAAPQETPAGGLVGAISRRFSSLRGAPPEAILAAAEPAAAGRTPSVEEIESDFDAADALPPSEANRPLEIGSGVPDIAALISRVRSQSRAAEVAEAEGEAERTDFIAAARRHAMAAAAEVDSLRSDEKLAGLGFGEGAEVVSRRRKPIMMAIGAVLLALMAMPLGLRVIDGFTAAPSDRQIAEAAAPEPRDMARIAEPSAPILLPPPPAAVSIAPAEGPATTVAAAPPAPEAPAAAPETPAATAEAELARAAPSVPELISPAAIRLPGDAPAADAVPAIDLSAAAKPTAEAETAAPSAGPDDTPDPVEKPLPVPVAAGPDLAALAAAPLPALPSKIGSAPLIAAAKEGNPTALFEIGLRLMEGVEGQPDPKGAIAWFEQAAGRNFAPAQYSLGTLYEKGNGVERDTVAARDWYTLAASQGNVRAMHNLAVLYATGVDGVSQPEEAAKWFTRAADHGMRDSQYNLGILYARGAGVPQNMEESYKWFSIVAASGDKDAADKRDEVLKALSPEQRKAAEAAVAGWQPDARIEPANTVDVPAEWSDAPADRTASVDMTRAVRNIQVILGKLGYDAGPPDGKVGARTTEAIRTFQADNGLSATGEIDEPLIRKLLERKNG